MNAAAYTAVDQAEQEPDQAMAINAKGAGAVADAARTLGVSVIHLSTDDVFDGRKSTPYVEEDPVAPANVYGASKLTGERAVTAATSDHVIVLTAWVYSPQRYGIVEFDQKNRRAISIEEKPKKAEIKLGGDGPLFLR